MPQQQAAPPEWKPNPSFGFLGKCCSNCFSAMREHGLTRASGWTPAVPRPRGHPTTPSATLEPRRLCPGMNHRGWGGSIFLLNLLWTEGEAEGRRRGGEGWFSELLSTNGPAWKGGLVVVIKGERR